MTKRETRATFNDCVVCGERVSPGEGTVVYPLPLEHRIRMPVSVSLYTNGVRHKTCDMPAGYGDTTDSTE